MLFIFMLYCTLFQLFDRISSTVVSSNRSPAADVVSRSRDVIELLTSVGGNKYLKDELIQILVSPHLQVCHGILHYLHTKIFIWQDFLELKLN